MRSRFHRAGLVAVWSIVSTLVGCASSEQAPAVAAPPAPVVSAPPGCVLMGKIDRARDCEAPTEIRAGTFDEQQCFRSRVQQLGGNYTTTNPIESFYTDVYRCPIVVAN